MLIARVRCSKQSARAPSTAATIATDKNSDVVGSQQLHPTQEPVAQTQWVEVNATVPIGSTGEIHVPIQSTQSYISESGVAVWHSGTFTRTTGVTKGALRGRFIVFETLSGQYQFVSSA